MQRQVSSLALAMALWACAMASLPENSREGDVTQLVSLLGKLKNLERARQQQQQQQQQYLPGLDLTSRHIASSFPSSSSSLSSSSSSSSGADATFKALASEINAYPQPSEPLYLPQRDLDLGDDFSDLAQTLRKRGRSMSNTVSADVGRPNKRQGSWSYDYGLGGGRFGKRNYGDYGIGGGRFGRDVDHVDISDTHEGDLATL